MSAAEDGNVLVAEDNPTNRFVICAMLKSFGIVPLIASDGAEAVRIAGQSTLKLILMDINMPVLNGMEAARRLGADPATASIPIVAVTATATTHQRQECEDAGFAGFVPKPVDVGVFQAAIAPYVETGRSI